MVLLTDSFGPDAKLGTFSFGIGQGFVYEGFKLAVVVIIFGF